MIFEKKKKNFFSKKQLFFRQQCCKKRTRLHLAFRRSLGKILRQIRFLFFLKILKIFKIFDTPDPRLAGLDFPSRNSNGYRPRQKSGHLVANLKAHTMTPLSALYLPVLALSGSFESKPRPKNWAEKLFKVFKFLKKNRPKNFLLIFKKISTISNQVSFLW